MTAEPKVLAILRIGILDSPIKGIIYLVDIGGQKSGLCLCQGLKSPVFKGVDETAAYHDCRDWFMNNYDGFVQVSKLEGKEEVDEIKNFQESVKASFLAN